jgi:uncharacterized pyridoxal phosphate-containing UPF0001 family protein
VLTSDEGTKCGIDPKESVDFIKFIYDECPRLKFKGLMTMGKLHDIDGFKVIRYPFLNP